MNLTRMTQQFLTGNLTLEDALPTQMPVYVNSVAYLFGVSALSCLGMLVLTGVVMTIFGPLWYHNSPAGRFVNSLHFWSVQIFFFAIMLHLITRYLKAAWREGRAWTWIVGVLTSDTANAQQLFGVAPADWFGVTIPINPPQDFVLKPLGRVAVLNQEVASALQTYEAATADQQQAWLKAYLAALDQATVVNGQVHIPDGDYGPVTTFSGIKSPPCPRQPAVTWKWSPSSW